LTNSILLKHDVHQSLTQFIQDVGIPNLVISDDSNAQVAGEFSKIASMHHIKLTMPCSPWQNQAESSIRELKRATICLMRKHNAPRRTWYYAGKAAARIWCLTANDICGGRTPEEVVTSNTPDISEDSQFEFHGCVWYRDSADFPNDKMSIGRCLGVADKCTSNMAFRILEVNSQVIARKLSLQKAELDVIKIQAEIATLDQGILSKIGDRVSNEVNLQEFPEIPIDFFLGKRG
jgi:hypothetical protein